MTKVSMVGLDLSFMKTSPPVRYQKPKQKRSPSKRSELPCPVLMTDIKSFVSPIDGEEITSRSKLRAHEKRHNVKQNGDWKPGEVVAKRNKRVNDELALAKGATAEWI